jgi:hypothetical protein
MSLTCITRGKAKSWIRSIDCKAAGKEAIWESGGEKLQKIKNTIFWGKALCSHLQEQKAFQPSRQQMFYSLP